MVEGDSIRGNSHHRLDIISGVTTAPRSPSVLPQCLASLKAAGLNPIIFAEPNSPLDNINAPIYRYMTKRGVFRNWCNAATELLSYDTDYVALFQDDIDVTPHALPVIQRFLDDPLKYLPRNTKRPGCISFYTPSHYFPRRQGWNLQPQSNLWGALGFLFPRDVLQALLRTSVFENWIQNRVNKSEGTILPSDISNLDAAIGRGLKELQLLPAYYTPSLSWHCAPNSSIQRGSNKDRRQALSRLEYLPSPIWEKVHDRNYYKHIRRLVYNEHGSIIDVGSGHNSGYQFLNTLPHLHRTSVDLPLISSNTFLQRENRIHYIDCDFMQLDELRQYGIATCINVVNELDDPQPFIEKLLRIANKVYLVVPYRGRITREVFKSCWRSTIIKEPHTREKQSHLLVTYKH